MERLKRALAVLDGVSVGDAFGERFFGSGQAIVGGVIAAATPVPPDWLAVREPLHLD